MSEGQSAVVSHQSSEGLPATEGVDPRYLHLDEWPSLVALDALLEAQMAAVAAVRPALPAMARAAEAASERLRRGGRLIYSVQELPGASACRTARSCRQPSIGRRENSGFSWQAAKWR